jgi:hypothetical protein
MKCGGYFLKNHNEIPRAEFESSVMKCGGYLLKICNQIHRDTFKKSQ